MGPCYGECRGMLAGACSCSATPRHPAPGRIVHERDALPLASYSGRGSALPRPVLRTHARITRTAAVEWVQRVRAPDKQRAGSAAAAQQRVTLAAHELAAGAHHPLQASHRHRTRRTRACRARVRVNRGCGAKPCLCQRRMACAHVGVAPRALAHVRGDRARTRGAVRAGASYRPLQMTNRR